jgi:hypothetical protein
MTIDIGPIFEPRIQQLQELLLDVFVVALIVFFAVLAVLLFIQSIQTSRDHDTDV